jgi:hypothetical protein
MRSGVFLATLCIGVLAFGETAEADSVFLFEFDSTFDATLTPPIVGTGTFSFAVDPGDGTHLLTSLGAFSMTFQFSAASFTEADIGTPLGEVLVILTTTGAGRRLQFSNVNGNGNGPAGGSLDLVGSILTFEPPAFGAGLNLYQLGDVQPTLAGTYRAFQAVPEPSFLVLLGTAVGVSLLRHRGRRTPRARPRL